MLEVLTSCKAHCITRSQIESILIFLVHWFFKLVVVCLQIKIKFLVEIELSRITENIETFFFHIALLGYIFKGFVILIAMIFKTVPICLQNELKT